MNKKYIRVNNIMWAAAILSSAILPGLGIFSIMPLKSHNKIVNSESETEKL